MYKAGIPKKIRLGQSSYNIALHLLEANFFLSQINELST